MNIIWNMHWPHITIADINHRYMYSDLWIIYTPIPSNFVNYRVNISCRVHKIKFINNIHVWNGRASLSFVTAHITCFRGCRPSSKLCLWCVVHLGWQIRSLIGRKHFNLLWNQWADLTQTWNGRSPFKIVFCFICSVFHFKCSSRLVPGFLAFHFDLVFCRLFDRYSTPQWIPPGNPTIIMP